MYTKYVYDSKTSREDVKLGKNQLELAIRHIPLNENILNLVIPLCGIREIFSKDTRQVDWECWIEIKPSRGEKKI